MRSILKILVSIRRFLIYRVLHVDDTPHRLSLGIALGLFVAWTPTIGLQMMLVILLASLLGANRRVGVPVVWVSNPLTLAPVYYPSYLLGRFLIGRFVDRPALEYNQINEMLGNLRSFSYIVSHLFEPEFWRETMSLLVKLGVELWVGSLIIAFIVGGIGYIVSYRIIVWYRTSHPRGRRFMARLKLRKQQHDVPDTKEN